MLLKTQAVVLRTIKYGENKLIVDFLTEQEGRVSCVVGRVVCVKSERLTTGACISRGGKMESRGMPTLASACSGSW
jgi:hypothetical protein